MINSIIIDDEQKAIILLRKMLKTHCPNINIVAEAQQINEAIRLIELHHPQLIFLDIELIGGNGFDLLEKIKQRNFHVIFVTAHAEFAIKAFRFSVTDYLLKPVNREILKQAVQKVKTLIDASSSDSKKQNDAGLQTLRIPSTNGLAFVYFKDIIRLEADGHYTHIYLVNGKHHISSYPIKQFEENLDSGLFLRAHRSHLINRTQIKSLIHKRGLFVEMTDGVRIEVPRRNKEDFLKKVHLKIEY